MVQFNNVERKENLSYAIGYYRKKKGYSQEQMAERLGISRQHLASVRRRAWTGACPWSCCSISRRSWR